MVQSMTGYGRGQWEEEDFTFQIEIKTVGTERRPCVCLGS